MIAVGILWYPTLICGQHGTLHMQISNGNSHFFSRENPVEMGKAMVELGNENENWN